MTLILQVILCCALVINLYYWGYLFLIQKEKPARSTVPPPVSLIICAHNEYDHLQLFLEKFLTQNHSEYEVIVVNDRSTDQTSSLLNHLKLRFPRLRTLQITETPQGWNPKKWALISGAKAAKHDYLLFSDADCYPSSAEWASRMSVYFGEKDMVIGYSPYQKKSNLLNHFIRLETLITAFHYMGFGSKGIPYMAVGRNWGIKKKLYLDYSFQQVKHLTGGDDDLVIQAVATNTNFQILTDHLTHIISIPKNTWRQFLLQKLRHISIGKAYSIQTKILIQLYHLSTFAFFVSSAVLLNQKTEITTVLVAYSLRCCFLFFTFGKNSKKLGTRAHTVLHTFLELLYNCFLWIWGPIALLAKKIKWK